MCSRREPFQSRCCCSTTHLTDLIDCSNSRTVEIAAVPYFQTFLGWSYALSKCIAGKNQVSVGKQNHCHRALVSCLCFGPQERSCCIRRSRRRVLLMRIGVWYQGPSGRRDDEKRRRYASWDQAWLQHRRGTLLCKLGQY